MDIARKKGSNLHDEDIYDVCFWYKCLALTLLAHVDALSTLMRKALTRHADDFGVGLTPNQRRKIAETDYNTPYLDGIKLAFRHFPRLFDVDLDRRISGEKFGAFRQLAKYYRDGLHHPKLLIHTYPLGLFRILTPAAEWFLASIRKVLSLCSKAADLEPQAIPPYAERFDYEPAAIDAMNRVTQELLQKELNAEPHKQFRYFLDYSASDVSKAADYWSRGATTWTARVARQLELRNFVRVLNAALEGATLTSSSILDEVGKGLGEGRRLLQGDPSDVAENIASTAEGFSGELGFARALSREDEGWKAVTDFRRLKNRITHPDDLAELQISEAEARGILSVTTWYSRQLLNCLQPRSDAALWNKVPKSLLGQVPQD